MKPACEIVSLEILPAFRALIAKKLVNQYGLSQKEAAEKMGISQPAVSQYKRDVRGYKTEIFEKNPRLMEMVDSFARSMASGEVSGFDLTLGFCEICKHIRFEGDACELHRRLDPGLASCSVCMENREFYGGKAERKTKPAAGKGKRKKEIKAVPLSKFRSFT